MRDRHPHRDLAFLINDVGRMLRTYADQEARRLDMTRAQWAVLLRVERNQGLKQSELADMLDLQPITLTRLVDRLCRNGLIERRPDPNDRRAKRLFLTPAARPLTDQLDQLGQRLMESILDGVPPEQTDTALAYLGKLKDNLRRLLSERGEADNEKDPDKHPEEPDGGAQGTQQGDREETRQEAQYA